MLRYRKKQAWINKIKLFKIIHILLKKIYRKAKLSPPEIIARKKDIGAFFFAPLRGTLTVEAAVVLPLFLMVMVAALQYGAVMNTAVKFGTSLAECAKSMAASAYISRYGGDAGKAPELAANVLSAAYAHRKVMSQAGDTSHIKNANMLLSSFLREEESIDLVLTYQIRTPFGAVKLPGNFFVQRGKVRAWTGREGGGKDGEGSGEEDNESGEYVYVTQTGSVYHTDSECTHLRLSVQMVDAGNLSSLRNAGGGKYHRCEKCGTGSPTGLVYITKEGDRYHSSLTCSGLKRTVKQVSKKELGNMRACSRCGK